MPKHDTGPIQALYVIFGRPTEGVVVQDAVDALIEAGLIDGEATEHATEVVAGALAAETTDSEEALAAAEAESDIKAVAAIEAMRALYAARIITAGAAKEAIDALVAADIIEAEAAPSAVQAVQEVAATRPHGSSADIG